MSNKVYEMITDRIIKELESGVIPWNRPWTGIRSGAYNRVTKKPYSLLNQMLLGKSGEWASFKQWKDAGGHIIKGEKSSIAVFWKIQQTEEITEDGTKNIKSIPLLRYYNLFHISQVEGVEPLQQNELPEVEPIEEAEKIKKSYIQREHITIDEVITNDAYYSPVRDYIKVPCKEQYHDIEEFYSTLFHEMAHSTGHKSRLDRLDNSYTAHFGSETYSKEELTAELSSAFILHDLGIDTQKSLKNSTAYVQGWLKVLKDDTKMIVQASSRAEKAVNYIMDR